jgi:NAD(P)-dependent dehydrogenase (short-subunit alcohol dehydrogenase family)
MEDENRIGKGSGRGGEPSPLAENKGKEGFPSQEQPWPGKTSEMEPRPDHGEESYRGSGKLEGRVALITGGDSGIGRAIAIAFAREGADVAISYLESHDDAKETVRWIEKAGRRAFSLSRDLQDPANCSEVVHRAVKELGRISILVNNAAYEMEQPGLEEISPEQLDRTFRTNLYAYIWMSQAALPQMKEGDTIINTGSVAALKGNARLIDYAATKAAIHSLTLSLAQAVAERGIRVNCVAPGPVWTPLIVSTRDREKIESFGKNTVWKRAAQPAEIAPSYVFLASADARYYTGEILAPTGSATTR